MVEEKILGESEEKVVKEKIKKVKTKSKPPAPVAPTVMTDLGNLMADDPPKKKSVSQPRKKPSLTKTVKGKEFKEDESKKKDSQSVEDILADIDRTEHEEKNKTLEKAKNKEQLRQSLTYKTPIRLYRRIALFFVLAAVVILVSALYFSLSKAEIIITPHKYEVSAEFNVNVEKVVLSENAITGMVIEDARTESIDYEIPGEGETRIGVAGGEVMLYNSTAINQVLVKTTRLLSAEGVLFHLRERVTVPARGSTRASVYADVEGEAGDIAPTRFTVPGLNASLQDKIYAESLKAMRGGKAVVKIVKDEDIKNAKESLKNQVVSSIREGLDKMVSNTQGLIFLSDVLEEKVSAKAGDEIPAIPVTMKIKTIAVIYDKAGLEKIAEEKIKLVIPAERLLKEVKLDKIEISLVRYDSESESAVLKASVPADTIIKDDAEILNKEHLIGLKKDDAKKYLEDFDEIEKAEIKTRPFFLLRSLPSIPERIKIKIQ